MGLGELAKLTVRAWMKSGTPLEKTGLIKHVFISNAGFLDRIQKIFMTRNVRDL